MPQPTQTEELEIEISDEDALATVTETLGSEGINIRGFMSYSEGTTGKACLVTDDPKKARTVLEAAGFEPRTTKTLMVPAPNEPGAFADIAKRLGKGGVRIQRSFVTTDESGKELGIGLEVDDPARARKLLGE